jgi:hypothetical protein
MRHLRPGLSLLLLCCSCAGRPEPSTPAIVPLRSLRLYETGVGYFERTGTVSGGKSLPVPTSHLDDALKSLVILGEGASVQALTFSSSLSKPMARAMVGIQDGETLAFPSLLSALKGVRVEVALSSGGEPLRGRLVELTEETAEPPAEPPRSGTEAPPRKDRSLVLLTEDGALRQVRLADVRSVRPLDPAFASRLAAGLDATSARGTQVQRALQLLGEGGPVTFGYIAETPVWRASYRIVLEPQKSAFQGWALLHNDTDEDWKNIRLSLVNGRPDSFLFPLAAPRYLRRELLRPDQPLPTTPQLLGQSADDLWSEADAFGAGGLGLSGVGEGGGGRGEGIGLGSVGTIGHGSGTGYGYGSGLLSVGNLASTAQSSGSEQGALFSYAVERPLSLPNHSSALVPFLEQRVALEPITWLEDGARIGVRFENTTGQTLPAGTVAVFHNGGFAGETTLDRIKPGERRFLTFGADLDVELNEHRRSSKDETARVVARDKDLEEHFLRTTNHTITLQNRSPLPRSVYLVLRLHSNAKVTGADALDYDTAQNKPVAIFRLEPRQKIERTFTSVEGLATRSPVEQLSPEQLEKLAQTPVSADEKAALRALAARRSEQVEAQKTLDSISAEVGEIQQEIERLRKNLEALGGDRSQRPEQNPFVRRLLAAEDRLAEARKKQDNLQKQASARKDAVLLALKKLPEK